MFSAAKRLFSIASEVKKVAVVGGGIAGMQVVDQFKQLGLECTIFEDSADVGGVWQSNYAEFGLQVPWELYEFPGFRYAPEENFERFPKGPEVQLYHERYARDRDIYPSCKFHSTVTKVHKNGKGWDIAYEQKGQTHEEKFDYAVICTGMYSLPNFP